MSWLAKNPGWNLRWEGVSQERLAQYVTCSAAVLFRLQGRFTVGRNSPCRSCAGDAGAGLAVLVPAVLLVVVVMVVVVVGHVMWVRFFFCVCARARACVCVCVCVQCPGSWSWGFALGLQSHESCTGSLRSTFAHEINADCKSCAVHKVFQLGSLEHSVPGSCHAVSIEICHASANSSQMQQPAVSYISSSAVLAAWAVQVGRHSAIACSEQQQQQAVKCVVQLQLQSFAVPCSNSSILHRCARQLQSFSPHHTSPHHAKNMFAKIGQVFCTHHLHCCTGGCVRVCVCVCGCWGGLNRSANTQVMHRCAR